MLTRWRGRQPVIPEAPKRELGYGDSHEVVVPRHEVYGMPTTHAYDEVEEPRYFPDLAEVPIVDMERVEEATELVIPDLPDETLIGLYPDFDEHGVTSGHPDATFVFQVHRTSTGNRVIRIWRGGLGLMPRTPEEARACVQFQQGLFILEPEFIEEVLHNDISRESGRIAVRESLWMPYFHEGEGRDGAVDLSDKTTGTNPGKILVIYPEGSSL